MSTEIEGNAPTRRRRVLISIVLLAGGLSLLVTASAFLIVGSPGRSSPQAASASFDTVGAGEEPQQAPQRRLDVAEELARVQPGAISVGLSRLAASLTPAPTPTVPPPTTAPPSPTHLPSPTAMPAAAPPAAPVAAPVASNPAPPPAAVSCPTAGMAGNALSLFRSINAERNGQGMAQLAAHGCAVYIGEVRSNDMASLGYFSHTSPNGSTAFSLLDAYAVPHGWAGENLARNNYAASETVAIAIRDLMASQGHRDNILSSNYSHLGVGFAEAANGMKYFTMVFLGPP